MTCKLQCRRRAPQRAQRACTSRAGRPHYIPSMQAWDADPFFQYPRTSVATSAGEVQLPILYYDDSQCMGIFLVEHAVAQAMVEAEGLDAVRVAGGSALAGVAFYEYRQTSIGNYNEVGVAIAVVPRGTPVPRLPALDMVRSLDKARVGFFILDLPVTTAIACAAGRELWGYPKFVTPIRVTLDGSHFRGGVSDPAGGGDIVTMIGNAGAAMPSPLLNLVLFSRHEGALLRTLVQTRGGGRVALPGSIKLTVGPSSHPMAHRLRQLGLDGASPAVVMYSERLQLRLNAGAPLPHE